MSTRRVVTGQVENGKSTLVSDEIIEPISVSSTAITSVWGADVPPHFPQDGTLPQHDGFFPGPGGYRFIMMTIPPHSVAAPSETEMEQIARDIGGLMETGDPGMHMTDTVDMAVVLSGEATQEFDDGAVVHLAAGDCFVQNGTRHRWSNRGSVPVVVACVLIGGHPR